MERDGERARAIAEKGCKVGGLGVNEIQGRGRGWGGGGGFN